MRKFLEEVLDTQRNMVELPSEKATVQVSFETSHDTFPSVYFPVSQVDRDVISDNPHGKVSALETKPSK